MKVSASGVRGGKKIKVEYDGYEYLFNGEPNFGLERAINDELKRKHGIGGTFYVEDVNDIRNVVNVISEHFFDRPVAVDVQGVSDEDIGIPYEEGVVY